MSLHSSPPNVLINTKFLSIAIHHARAEFAHLYAILPHLNKRQRQEKKRLWWCCLVRDRTIALGLRRQLQLSADHMSPYQEPMTEEDFENEIGNSRVFDPETKRSLIKIFITQCDLAIAITATIMTVYPPNGFSIFFAASRPDIKELSRTIHGCRQDLTSWSEKAKARFGSIQVKKHHDTDFAELYTNLLWIYHMYVAFSSSNHRN